MKFLTNKLIFIFLSFSILALLCFISRYEYTRYPNGKIHQRINRLTGNVEIFCCSCENECNWRKGNHCPYTTRKQIIDYGYYHGKSVTDINEALKKNCFNPLGNDEISR